MGTNTDERSAIQIASWHAKFLESAHYNFFHFNRRVKSGAGREFKSSKSEARNFKRLSPALY